MVSTIVVDRYLACYFVVDHGIFMVTKPNSVDVEPTYFNLHLLQEYLTFMKKKI